MPRTKYEYWLSDDGRQLLEAWVRNGLTQEQLAKNMGISTSTLREWTKHHPNINSIMRGNARELADIEVENALRKRALGYTHVEITKERQLNKATGMYEFVTVREVTKTVPPDTTAAIFWLKNRKPSEWRDKRDVPAPVDEVPDDGFIKALSAKAAEVMADGGDEPRNVRD